MRLIKDGKINTIIMEDDDTLNIKTMKGNNLCITVECKDGSFIVDEVSIKRIRDVKIEEEQVKKLKSYQNKK